MEREKITRELLSSALRHLRTSRRLTQRDLARRAAVYRDHGFGRLLESQISDFERGRALPSLGSLLNLLAACSESGSQVDFAKLQRAIETVGAVEDEAAPCSAAVDGALDPADRIVSERTIDGIRDEMAALRTRLARTEQLIGSLLGTDRPGIDLHG